MALVLLTGPPLSLLVTGLFWLLWGHPTATAPHSITPLYMVFKFCSFYFLNSPTIYTLLSPNSPSWGPCQHSPSLLRWPLPWSSPDLTSHICLSLFSLSQHCPWRANLIVLLRGLQILQSLLSVKTTKSKILSTEYQTPRILPLPSFWLSPSLIT